MAHRSDRPKPIRYDHDKSIVMRLDPVVPAAIITRRHLQQPPPNRRQPERRQPVDTRRAANTIAQQAKRWPELPGDVVECGAQSLENLGEVEQQMNCKPDEEGRP